MKRIAILTSSLLFAATAATASAGPSAPDFAHANGPHDGVGAELAGSDASNPMAPVDMIHFGFGSSQLDAADRAQLEAAATWLASHPDQRLVLEGHTDKVGSAVYNNWLAGRRANAVRDQLITAGADGDRLVVVTYGESVLTSPGNAANRRVVVHAEPLQAPVLIGERQ